MSKPLMQCGHTANAVNGYNKPVCAICYGIKPGAALLEPIQPELIDRRARCTYYSTCHEECDSSLDLPFFEYRPSYPTDVFYCGCKGWD